MNCLQKGTRQILFSLFFFLFSAFVISPVYADYSSISLSPSEGVIFGDSTEIKVLVDSGETEFVGVDFYLNFTGDIEYIDATGATRCNSFDATPSSGSLNITCLSLDHAEGEGYDGVIATLTFRATGEGTSQFTFGETDPVITNKAGGEYTLSPADENDGSNSGTGVDDGTDGTTEEGEDLPEAGIFDDSRGIIIAGISLILLGFFFNSIAFPFYLSLDKKLRNKRRDELEKKF